MKKEISRRSSAPAFSLDLAELDVLVNRILKLFDDGESIYCSISLGFPNETLTFDSVSEIKDYPGLKGIVPNFGISVSQGISHHVSVNVSKSSMFQIKPYIWISGADDAWCAGAMETVLPYLKSHKTWYSPFLSTPFVMVLLAYVVFMPGVITSTYGTTINLWSISGYISVLVLFLFLFVFRKRIFPANQLRITEEQGIVRKYGLELTLLMAFLSMLFTALGVFLDR